MVVRCICVVVRCICVLLLYIGVFLSFIAYVYLYGFLWSELKRINQSINQYMPRDSWDGGSPFQREILFQNLFELKRSCHAAELILDPIEIGSAKLQPAKPNASIREVNVTF